MIRIDAANTVVRARCGFLIALGLSREGKAELGRKLAWQVESRRSAAKRAGVLTPVLAGADKGWLIC